MISSDFVSNRSCENGKTLENIMRMKQEIGLIRIHDSEHVKSDGKVLALDKACPYCRRHSTIDENSMVGVENKKKSATSQKELRRMADISGINGCVIVPRSWAGKNVRIILVED